MCVCLCVCLCVCAFVCVLWRAAAAFICSPSMHQAGNDKLQTTRMSQLLPIAADVSHLTHTHTHTHTRTHAHTHAYKHTHTHAHTNTPFAHRYALPYTDTHTHRPYRHRSNVKNTKTNQHTCICTHTHVITSVNTHCWSSIVLVARTTHTQPNMVLPITPLFWSIMMCLRA